METLELGRKIKRNCENIVSKKRLVLVLILCIVIFVYVMPYVVKWIGFRPKNIELDVIDACLNDRLTSFYIENDEFNVNIVHDPSKPGELNFLGYVGNGYFGIDVVKGGNVFLKGGRSMSLSSKFHPILTFKHIYSSYRSAYVVNYLTGIVHLYQCFDNGFYASFQYFAHRRLSSLLVQEIKLSNPSDRAVDVEFDSNHPLLMQDSSTKTIEVYTGENHVSYNLTSGIMEVTGEEGNRALPVTIIQKASPSDLRLEARSSKKMVYYTSISYSDKSKPISEIKSTLERKAIADITKGAAETSKTKESHARAWQELWSTGFTIQTSKAKDVLNGNKINATIYYVLSQVREEHNTSEVATHLSYAEGCYGNHHTLEATNLWGSLDTVEDLNKIASVWLLTLEKHGCHNILRAGARGVIEAMVLSFGGLRFSNQHLEFNIDPKYLHRDYLFRRIAYGNRTHVNISVVVQNDNKAILRVALDRSDKNYYACDGGCLDTPVQLGPEPVTFPVKLTEPLTAILYVTYDKQHMEELRNAIHVREIAEAPAHEHHVIALHKHGHHLGGLPTFFWVSVLTLILIFHLFLFKLVYNEYFAANNTYDRHRVRYGRL